MLWIGGFGEINVENRAVFWLFLNSAGTASRLAAPAQEIPWGGQKIGQGPKVGKGLFNTMQHHAQQQKQRHRKKGRRGWVPRWPLLGDWRGISLLAGGGERLPLHSDALLPFTQLSGSQPKSSLTSGHSVLSHLTGGNVSAVPELGVVQVVVKHWAFLTPVWLTGLVNSDPNSWTSPG